MRRLWRQLLAVLAPRIEPDEKPYRVQLARAAVRVSLVLLTAWLLVEVLILQLLRPQSNHAWRFDLLAMLALALVLLVAKRFVRQGRTTMVGYLLAISYFFYPLLNAVLVPQDIYLVNVAFLISVFRLPPIMETMPFRRAYS